MKTRLSLIALIVLLALSACSPAQPAAPTSPATAPTSTPASVLSVDASELFFVRPNGAKGPLIAYGVASGRERFRLPAGLLSADGAWFVAMEQQGDRAQATLYDATTGRPRAQFDAGEWTLAALSPTGAKAVFTLTGAAQHAKDGDKATTSFKVVDTASGQTDHLLHLQGTFEVETISADGKSLFLIEHLPGADKPYLIRLYDLSAEQLLADPLRAKGPDEVMAGYAWNGLGSADGHWLLTLYLSTRRNKAFLHALNLINKFPFCIELPSGDGDFEKLKQYSLALSPDQQLLYLANTALGVVVQVDLAQLTIVRRASFPAQPERRGPALSALSRDGSKLYFSGGGEVWAYAVKTNAVLSPFPVEGSIIGLGVSGDGRQLLVARPDQPLLVLDAATGRAVPVEAAAVP